MGTVGQQSNKINKYLIYMLMALADPGGGAPGARPP